MMNVNPLQLIQMIKNGSNPQQLVMSVLEQQGQNNPFYQNLMDLAKGNNTVELEKIARNMLKERGLDYDKEFSKFKQEMGF